MLSVVPLACNPSSAEKDQAEPWASPDSWPNLTSRLQANERLCFSKRGRWHLRTDIRAWPPASTCTHVPAHMETKGIASFSHGHILPHTSWHTCLSTASCLAHIMNTMSKCIDALQAGVCAAGQCVRRRPVCGFPLVADRNSTWSWRISIISISFNPRNLEKHLEQEQDLIF